MENNQIMMKEKQGFFGIVKETVKIPAKNPSFIVLALLTSFPLFCFSLLHERLLHQTLLEIIQSLTELGRDKYWLSIVDAIRTLIPVVISQRSLVWGFLYFAIGYPLDLLHTIIIVHSASLIYATKQQDRVLLKEMLFRTFPKVGFKGPFVTSIYVLILTSLTWIGLVSSATEVLLPVVFSRGFGLLEANFFSSSFFWIAFIALLIKSLEWTAIWYMGIVISILEGKHGDVALGVSAYISRGSRKRGLLLMLVFFVWRLVLRLTCLYAGWIYKGSGVLAASTVSEAFFSCISNVILWVACMVYYCDCKKRFLEKKVDMEQGRAAETVK